MSDILASVSKLGGGRGGAVIELVKMNRGLLFPIGAIMVMLTFFVPLPPLLIDILICLNLALTFIVVVQSLSISSALQLTTYPTILLITPIFRLCLSLAITRSVLESGHAGDIIAMIGTFSARGNLVVAFVTFVMILFVQFIVVTKGAERVAEVAARFTLDAMPGKQMAIDADLRSGLITQDQARVSRTRLQQESQLYGAMDGAMKFVKGDAVATIVLALVNICGGLAVGVLYRGMSFSQAARKYTILTVGDGLAAIITSMMIATAAGFVITRVTSEDRDANVSSDLLKQFLSDPRPLWLTAAAVLAMGLIPGSPAMLLIVVATALGGIGYAIYRTQTGAQTEAQTGAQVGAPSMARGQNQRVGASGSQPLVPSPTIPLALAISSGPASLADPASPSGARLRQSLQKLRSSLYYDFGVIVPPIYTTMSLELSTNEYLILIKEIAADKGSLRTNSLFVNDSAENIRIFGIEGEEVRNPADLRPGAWIPEHQRNLAVSAGLKIWEGDEIITLHLSRILKRHLHEFIGLQEAQWYLDFMMSTAPALASEVVPKTVSLQQFTEILQRLAQEGVSIRDLKTILEALGEWGRVEKDTVLLTERVRSAFKRNISFRYAAGRSTLFVYLLDPEIEDVIAGAIRRTATGTFLALDPAVSQEILSAFRREIPAPTTSAQKPVILTDMELRRFVKKLVETEFPTLAVLSYQELAPELSIQPLARISMQPSSDLYTFNQPNDDNRLSVAGGRLSVTTSEVTG